MASLEAVAIHPSINVFTKILTIAMVTLAIRPVRTASSKLSKYVRCDGIIIKKAKTEITIIPSRDIIHELKFLPNILLASPKTVIPLSSDGYSIGLICSPQYGQ